MTVALACVAADNVITLRIPEMTPSLNRLMRSHWATNYRRRTHWYGVVRAVRCELGLYPPPKPDKVRVTIFRWGPRMLDHDNFIAGTKFLTDALVKEGFAVDDSPAHMESIYFQHVGKPHRTLVCIQPLESP